MTDDHANGVTEDDFEAEEAYDDEGTLDEEEMLNPEDYQEELRILRDDAALTIEQLRAKYCSDVPGVAANGTSEDGESCSTAPYEISNGVEEHQPHANGNSEIEIVATANPEYGYFMDDGDDNENDKDYSPPGKRSLRRGQSYQAFVPSSPSRDICQQTERATLLWTPYGRCTPKEVEEYLKECYKKTAEKESEQGTSFLEARRTPSAPKRNFPLKDDENALKALLNAQFDVKAALARYPFEPCNAPLLTIGSSPAKWNVEDCDTFERGLQRYGKNFYLIQHMMPHRTVGELVHFYYIWKKTERHDMFEERTRGQRQHPNTTDYMGNLIDHLDATAGAQALDISNAIPANIERELREQWEGSSQGALPNLDSDTVANVLQ